MIAWAFTGTDAVERLELLLAGGVDVDRRERQANEGHERREQDCDSLHAASSLTCAALLCCGWGL
jgi:hypothetical protein